MSLNHPPFNARRHEGFSGRLDVSDEWLGKPCSLCGKIIGGGGTTYPNCKIGVCFTCVSMQIMECKDVEALKSGSIPKCPKCGRKLV